MVFFPGAVKTGLKNIKSLKKIMGIEGSSKQLDMTGLAAEPFKSVRAAERALKLGQGSLNRLLKDYNINKDLFLKQGLDEMGRILTYVKGKRWGAANRYAEANGLKGTAVQQNITRSKLTGEEFNHLSDGQKRFIGKHAYYDPKKQVKEPHSGAKPYLIDLKDSAKFNGMRKRKGVVGSEHGEELYNNWDHYFDGVKRPSPEVFQKAYSKLPEQRIDEEALNILKNSKELL